MNSEPIQRFVAGWPRGQNSPEALLWTVGGGAKPEEATPIQHGLCLRLRISLDKAELRDLRLNGHPVAPSETDGYLQWVARGYTYVQVAIPPERAKAEDLLIVTCEYDPCEKRTRWRGW